MTSRVLARSLVLVMLLIAVEMVPMKKEDIKLRQKFFEELEELKEVLEEDLDLRGQKETRDHIVPIAVSSPLLDAYHSGSGGNQEHINRRDNELYKRDIVCPTPSDVVCDPTDHYRSIDGTCNNLQEDQKEWGKAGSLHLRISEDYGISYEDGESTPQTLSTNLVDVLPDARKVSNGIFKTENDIFSDPDLDNKLTLMVMQWGQFLDHDIIHTDSAEYPITSSDCCNATKKATLMGADNCFEIVFETEDSDVYPNSKNCIPNKRSAQFDDCRLEADGNTTEFLNQKNSITAFIDASNVYGSEDALAAELRDSSDSSLLKVAMTAIGTENLPNDDNTATNNICGLDSCETVCYQAGDVRANEQAGLTLLHTLFAREHNRIARELKDNGMTDNEEVYQLTRKIVGATMQWITFDEFVPLLIDQPIRQSHRLNLNDVGYTTGPPQNNPQNEYDSRLKPGIFSNFAIGYRVGHLMVLGFIETLNKDLDKLRHLRLSDVFFKPTNMQRSTIPDDAQGLTRFYINQLQKKVDRIMTEELRSFLFKDTASYGDDLAALNLQRSRDWGTVRYNDMRRHCEFPASNSFVPGQALPDISPEVTVILSNLYSNPNDIDLFAGMACETPLQNGIGGRVLQCILAEQFQRLRLADRFWFDHPQDATTHNAGFTEAQVNEIKKHSLAAVLCENVLDTDDEIRDKVMRKQNGNNNPSKTCETLLADKMNIAEFVPFP